MQNRDNDTLEETTHASPPTSSVIWLHGLGADASDFTGIHHALGLPRAQSMRFIFPNAPHRPVTINAGMVMPAWYDIYGLTKTSREDEAGVIASEKSLHMLIDKEVGRGIPANKIFLAGFSQGGAVALFTALRYPQPLAGVIGLSSYLPLAQQITTTRNLANQNTPIFLAHGTGDPIVTYDVGKATHKHLTDLNYGVTWHEYPMAHNVIPDELVDLGRWMQGVVA